MELMRSLLFVPGNRPNMIEKALSLAPDVLVLDLEDSVPASEKENARATVRKALAALPAGAPPVFARVNSWYTDFIIPDIEAVVGPGLSGIMVPKTDQPADLVKADAIIQAFEQLRGRERDSIKIIGSVESAASVLHAEEIARASSRMVGIMIGLDDFTIDMSIPRSEDSTELLFPRIKLALACASAGINALDGVFVDYKNEKGLVAETGMVRKLGFRGKFCIHPSQIEPVNRTFAVQPAEVEMAREIVKAFEEAVARGSGATSLYGKMIDTPVAERARKLIRQADAIDTFERQRRKNDKQG